MYPIPENVTSFSTWLEFLNTVTQENFGWLVITALFFIIFVSLKSRYETDRALTVSLYLTSILALFFFFVNLIEFYILLVFMLGTAISTLYLWFHG